MRIGLARRMPAGLLGMVGLALALEWAIARNERHFYGPEAWDWRVQGRAGDATGAAGEVLLLGDSQLKFGLSSLLLTERLGRSARAVAPGGCSPAAQYYLLKRTLQRGGRPAAAVVAFMPALLLFEPVFSEAHWADLLSTREAAHLAGLLADPAILVRIVLNQLVPSIRDRHEIRAAFSQLVHGRWVDKQPHNNVFAWHQEKNLGNMVLPAPAADPTPLDCESWHAKLYPWQWSCRSVHVFFMRKFFALAAERGIPVYWVLFPVCPELQRLFESTGGDERYGELVAQLSGEQSNVVVLDARRSAYDASTFSDPIHLNIRGNARLSTDVGTYLADRAKNRPAGERWVVMPRYADSSNAASLEDFTQSYLSMRKEWVERQGQARSARGL